MGLRDECGHECAAEFGEPWQERRLRRRNEQEWKIWSLGGGCKRLQHHLLLISAGLESLGAVLLTGPAERGGRLISLVRSALANARAIQCHQS